MTERQKNKKESKRLNMVKDYSKAKIYKIIDNTNGIYWINNLSTFKEISKT